MTTILKSEHYAEQGQVYWGAMPLPSGGRIVGIVRRDAGVEGALISFGPGMYAQGNDGRVCAIPTPTVTEKSTGRGFAL